ncbi:MAG: DEAD/DEAH box helicase, partial [Planctomycetota bacterium]
MLNSSQLPSQNSNSDTAAAEAAPSAPSPGAPSQPTADGDPHAGAPQAAPDSDAADAGGAADAADPGDPGDADETAPEGSADAGSAAPDAAPTEIPLDGEQPSRVLNEAEHPPQVETFAELNLSDQILNSLNRAGFTKPTPIQAAMIPHALRGRDMVGQARTGTGKTGAFLIPIFQMLDTSRRGPQALIMAPTRELAQQIGEQILLIGYNLPFKHVCITGGEHFEPQVSALRKGVDIVVGTPGRLIDLYKKRILNFDNLNTIVLDEADRMLDFGFRPDIEYILRRAPKERQTLMLSATFSDDILYLTKRYMREPEMLRISRDSLTVPTIEQYYRLVERPEKFQALLDLVRMEKPRLAIIFCNTRALAKRLASKLLDVGLNAHEIHGDLEQKRRNTVMGKFRKGIVHLLVATDVASRGIDVDGITHIVNYDVPQRIEDYVHRIGRTGRMERAGRAITFVTHEEGPILTEIEQLINQMLVAWTPNRGPVVQPEPVESAAPAADAEIEASAEPASTAGADASSERNAEAMSSEPNEDAAGDGDAARGGEDAGDRQGRRRGRRRRGGRSSRSEQGDRGDRGGRTEADLPEDAGLPLDDADASHANRSPVAESPEYGRSTLPEAAAATDVSSLPGAMDSGEAGEYAPPVGAADGGAGDDDFRGAPRHARSRGGSR